jgi:hypothetical protein
MDNSASEGPFHPKCREDRDNDFDDGANAFWSLYGKEAKTHDEACFLSQAKDMDSVLIFVRISHHFVVDLKFIPSRNHRPVCFLLHLLLSLLKALKICK